MAKYSIGLDYGTLSVRALLIDIHTGEELGVSIFEYPHAVMETHLPTGEILSANMALQDPQDYVDGLIFTVRDVVKKSGVLPNEIIGIGIDFTGSTILPVRIDGFPLCKMETYKKNPHAYVKLWKHHSGEKEAIQIDRIIRERKEKWISLYGGKVSSEWMLPKVLETLHHAPEIYENADRFIEALDWIIWQLTGEEVRSICGAGYKAFYRHEAGYPSKDFFRALDLHMENYVEEKMSAMIKEIGSTAGYLTKEMADVLGLMPGIPVGTGIFDALAAVLGSGISTSGEMMIVMGTSACHLLLAEDAVAVPGVCGIVKDGILPGFFGYEAGQSCVGDLFAWFIQNCIPESYASEGREKKINIHQLLAKKLEGYQAGQSGLLALDWFNGVRSPLMDFNLNGMILGLNLLTKPEEIYLALIEATAFGTRLIIEQFEQAGISINSIVMSGGIPKKNPLLVQIYADILKRDVRVCESAQVCAMGAAMLGVAAAEKEVTGYQDICQIVNRIGLKKGKMVYSKGGNAEKYDVLYEEYRTLQEYFGKGGNQVMKYLNKMRELR